MQHEYSTLRHEYDAVENDHHVCLLNWPVRPRISKMTIRCVAEQEPSFVFFGFRISVCKYICYLYTLDLLGGMIKGIKCLMF